jgi:putative lipase involved disintegration of autophagic bodies
MRADLSGGRFDSRECLFYRGHCESNDTGLDIAEIQNLYNNVTYMYPNANIWLVGHSVCRPRTSLEGDGN